MSLARTTPGGFAGVYFEPVPHNSSGQSIRQPRIIIRLAHPGERSQALHALLPQLPATFGGIAIDSADVSIIPAKWNHAQLDEWRRYLGLRLGIAGIFEVGIDEVKNQIHYGVRDSETRESIERRLHDLHVPCGLVNVEVVGPDAPRAVQDNNR